MSVWELGYRFPPFWRACYGKPQENSQTIAMFPERPPALTMGHGPLVPGGRNILWPSSRGGPTNGPMVTPCFTDLLIDSSTPQTKRSRNNRRATHLPDSTGPPWALVHRRTGPANPNRGLHLLPQHLAATTAAVLVALAPNVFHLSVFSLSPSLTNPFWISQKERTVREGREVSSLRNPSALKWTGPTMLQARLRRCSQRETQKVN